MTPEQTILVQLVDKSGGSLHLPGVYVDVEFYTRGNYRYGFRLSPTNDNGELHIDYGMVEGKRAEGARIFLMDYNTPITDCDSRIKIYVPAAEELKKAHEGIGRWFDGRTPAYAAGWLTANNAKIKAKEVFSELQNGETLVQVPCEVISTIP